MRRSSKRKDAARSSAEMAVRDRPRRSSQVKSLRVETVAPSVVAVLIEREHYLHSMPAVVARCFAVFSADELGGAVVFTSGARLAHRLLAGGRPGDVVTLARLWLSDSLPKNSESRVIGYVLRTLRREARWKLVLSYADPVAGHRGTIYRASGFVYLGQTEAESSFLLSDGCLHHPRSVFDRYGSNSLRHLRATGVPVSAVTFPGKYRYAYPLDPSWRWRLRAESEPPEWSAPDQAIIATPSSGEAS